MGFVELDAESLTRTDIRLPSTSGVIQMQPVLATYIASDSYTVVAAKECIVSVCGTISVEVGYHVFCNFIFLTFAATTAKTCSGALYLFGCGAILLALVSIIFASSSPCSTRTPNQHGIASRNALPIILLVTPALLPPNAIYIFVTSGSISLLLDWGA